MEGRTTFVIAHRLSTIALADEIVVLEDGRVVAQGTHDELLEESELYREIAERGLPDQVFLNRKPRSGRWRACEARRGTILRGERGRTRKLGKLLALLRPYRGRVILMFVALVVATAASLAPPYLAGRAIDDGIRAGDTGALTVILVVVRGGRAGQLGRHLRSRPTWSAGSASARCRTCARASSPTSSRCRSASTRATRRAC